MAEDPNIDEQGAPPRQMPFKTVTIAPHKPMEPVATPAEPAAGAAAPASDGAPRTVVLRRPTLRRPGEAPKSPLSPATPKPVTLKPPVVAPISPALSNTDSVAKGIEIPHSEAVKKVTSRISVSSATAPIPPISIEATTAAAAPAGIATAAAPAGVAPAVNEKKITSRITLESAFASQPDTSPAQPKTIRLKRPGEVAPKAASPISLAKPPEAPAPAPENPAAAPEQVAAPALPEGMVPISEIENGAAAEEQPLTRRKTIKVKRPGAGGGSTAPKIQIARPDGVPSEEDNLQSLSNFTGGAKPVSGPDKVNPFFIVAAVLAIVFASLLIWTLTSQSYGERGAAGDFALPKGPSISPPPWLQTFD